MKEYIARLRKEIEEEDRQWKKDLAKLTTSRKMAKSLEQEKKYEEAIAVYKWEIDYCEEKLEFVSFSHSIHRIIILLGKLKRKDELRLFLQEIISKYPHKKEVPDWKKRLGKLS